MHIPRAKATTGMGPPLSHAHIVMHSNPHAHTGGMQEVDLESACQLGDHMP